MSSSRLLHMSTSTPENTPNTTDGITNDSTRIEVKVEPSVRLVTSTSSVKRIAFCADCEMSWASQRSRKLRLVRTGLGLRASAGGTTCRCVAIRRASR